MWIIHATIISLVGLLTLPEIFGQYIPKPWPTYSLQNMPRTSFSCQDKILGGYYADPETQCQMFHVCVKVAGVGVKDFRFLCPNGTAFDQEAQICADWGDVDCEQSTLYYSSDNFDLYRLGSGFESKRAPVAEDETPYHLQRAESNDARRSQQQSSNNQNINRNNVESYEGDSSTYSNKPNYGNNRDIPKVRTTTTTTTTESTYQVDRRGDDEIFKGSHSSNFFNNKNNGKDDDLVDFSQKPQRNQINRGRQRPQNTYRNSYNNNNNIQTFPSKVNETATSTTTVSTPTPSIQQTTRYHPIPNIASPRQQINSKTLTLQSSFRTVETSDYNNNNNNQFPSPTTEALPPTRNYQLTNRLKTNPQQKIQPTTYNPPHSSFAAESTTVSYDDFKSFEKVSTASSHQYSQPTHNTFYNIQFENKATERSFEHIRNQEYQYNNAANNRNTSTTNQIDEVTSKSSKRLNAQRQNFYNEKQNYEGDLTYSLGEKSNDNIFFQSPTPSKSRRPTQFRGSKNYSKIQIEETDISRLNVRPIEPRISTQSTSTEQPRKFEQNLNNAFPNYRSSPQPSQSPTQSNYNASNTFGFSDNYRPVPSPFSLPFEHQTTRQSSTRNSSQVNYDYSSQNDYQTIPTFNQSPRGFSSNPSYTTQNLATSQSISTTSKPTNFRKYEEKTYDNYTPSTAVKKFSTLVPKDQFYPTTFKPATYKKIIQGYDQKVGTSTQFTAASYLPTTSTTTFRPPTLKENINEDDGQYHPELYEQDFARNKFKTKQQEQQSFDKQQKQSFDNAFDRRPVEQSSANSDEEEFLNTAHSLNIAAGANQLRAGKTKQSSPAILYRIATTSTTSAPRPSQPSSRRPTVPAPTKKHNKRPNANEDTSYDYAYYDSFSGSPQDYSEYDLISEFGKTKKN